METIISGLKEVVSNDLICAPNKKFEANDIYQFDQFMMERKWIHQGYVFTVQSENNQYA